MVGKISNAQEAVNELLAGNIVALPTETVYGLAVDMGNLRAVHKLYSLKGRPLNKPSSIAVTDPKEIKHWVKEISEDAQKLIDAFWPGPLTLVLPASANVPREVNAGYPTIGVRCPASEIIREVITLLGRPICLTSANLAGEKEATTALEVRNYFHDDILIFERDEIISGVVSTIVDLSQTPHLLLREGAIPYKEIQKIVRGQKVEVKTYFS